MIWVPIRIVELIRLAKDETKQVFAAASVEINGTLFKVDSVAVIGQLELFLVAVKLVYYETGSRKFFMVALDLKSNQMHSVVGCAWLLRSSIRDATDEERKQLHNISPTAKMHVLRLPPDFKSTGAGEEQSHPARKPVKRRPSDAKSEPDKPKNTRKKTKEVEASDQEFHFSAAELNDLMSKVVKHALREFQTQQDGTTARQGTLGNQAHSNSLKPHLAIPGSGPVVFNVFVTPQG